MSAAGTPHISYAIEGERLFIDVEKSATHRVSLTAEQLLVEFLDKCSSDTPSVVLSLEGCQWVDSTFAGWMVRVRQRLQTRSGTMTITSCTNGCLASLNVMGLTGLFHFEPIPFPSELHRVSCPVEEADVGTIEFMLSAHENLADANPANEQTFSPITQELRRQLREKKR